MLNSEKALYKKRPFPGICRMISSTGKRFVTLHRPPPEMASLRPSLFPLSIKRTSAPCSPAAIAAINPEGPPPMTMTSKYFIPISSTFLSCKACILCRRGRLHQTTTALHLLIITKERHDEKTIKQSHVKI
ncbi:hypothetical protein CHCC15315_0833 [Bacillus licheniformis]|nr:hypothetical protein CHCC15315_0833 [Bacillus licheniformis]